MKPTGVVSEPIRIIECEPPAGAAKQARAIVQDLEQFLYFSPDVATETSDLATRAIFESNLQSLLADLPHAERFFVERRCSWIKSGKGMLAAKIESEDYLGGAHPSRTRRYRTYLIESGAALKLSEVFLPHGVDHVKALLHQMAKRDPRALSSDTLELAPSDEFALTPDGVLFAFQPYELAAYVDSPRDILLPWTDLLAQLNPVFFEKMGAK